MKNKNHTIISKNDEQNTKVIKKALNRLCIKGTYINITKAISDKPMDNIILNGKKTDSIPLRARIRQGGLLSPLLRNKSTESPSYRIRHDKEIKGIQIKKGELKWLSFVDYMILYKENPKKPVKKLLGLISFSRVAGCKRNIKNLVAFLYTTDEASEKEIKTTIPFIIVLKTIEYIGTNLTKEVKDVYGDNYETLMKEDKNKWKDTLGSWIIRINTVKMAILSKALNLQIQSNPHQNAEGILYRDRRNNPAMCM